MNRHEKLRLALLSGQSDANIDFQALCNMLQHFGFEMRTRGSHHIFVHADVREMIVLPRHDRHVKRPYVRQVRDIFIQYHVGEGRWT